MAQWGAKNFLPLNVVQLKGKYGQKPHWRNGSCRYVRGWFLTWLVTKSYSWNPTWFSKSQKWKMILQKTQNDPSKPTTYSTNNHHIHYHSRMCIHSALRAHKKEQWKITWLLYGNWLWSKLSSLLLLSVCLVNWED